MIRRLCALSVLSFASNLLFSQDKLRGLEWEDDFYNSLPLKVSYFREQKRPPASFSIKNYCPRIINQSSSNTAVAWSAVWYARTIQEAIHNGWKDNTLITSQAFSPAFNYRHSTKEAGCNNAVKLSAVLESLNRDGAIPFSNFREFCVDSVSENLTSSAHANRLPGYVRLFYTKDPKEKKIATIKAALFEGHPVVLGIICPPTFSLAGEFWQPRSEVDKNFGGHTVTVVGYNDSKYGGAIEIVNSWGQTWGEKGFSWMLYSDAAIYAQYGYELLDVNKENRPLEMSMTASSEQGSTMPVRLNPNGLYQFGYSYPTGTKFNFSVELNQPVFFYAIGFDRMWNHVKLYPSEEGLSPWLPKDFLKVTMPDSPKFIELFDPPGRNYICLLFSGTALDIGDYILKIQQEKEDFFKQQYTMSKGKIEWSRNEVSFQSPFNKNSIIPLLVELDQVPK